MDRQKIERSIKGLSEWQMHVQAESDIDTNISTAIEALKAQLSQEGITSDTISRQQAIDIVVFECGKWTGLAKEISKQLKQLPPAQPEPHEGQWIWVAGDLECSKCHTRYPDLYPDYDNSVACPHCGARMKGASE